MWIGCGDGSPHRRDGTSTENDSPIGLLHLLTGATGAPDPDLKHAGTEFGVRVMSRETLELHERSLVEPRDVLI